MSKKLAIHYFDFELCCISITFPHYIEEYVRRGTDSKDKLNNGMPEVNQ
jgi:hypothetical protein